MSDNELFPVPDAWASRAFADNEKYLSMYQQSVDDPDGFWREQGKRRELCQGGLRRLRFRKPILRYQ